MNTIWFTFIVAVQFACAVCSLQFADGQNIGKLATQEVDNRIFKGEAAPIKNLPYQVFVSTRFREDGQLWDQECGGAILRPKIIITAAHCVDKKEDRKIAVRAGSSLSNRDGVTRKVEEVIVHESFKLEFAKTGGFRSADYDVALLKLSESLAYSEHIQNVEIPEQDDILAPGDLGIIAGWGVTFDKSDTTVLQKTQLPVMSNEECKGKSKLIMNPRIFCAGYYKTNTSTTCDGDSGGPFVKNNKIYGVASASVTDCKGDPSVSYFTNISSVHTWITTKLTELS